MTLLDDLRGLDLSDIADARLSISASVGTDGVRAVVDGGAVTSALGDVGAMVTRLTEALDDPETLFAPLTEALTAVAGDLEEMLGLESLPLDDYLRAVTDGVELVTSLFDGIGDDPLSLLEVAGRGLPDLLGDLPGRAGDVIGSGLESVGVLGSVIRRLESGLPTDAAGLLDASFDVLLPFPRQTVDALRLRVDALLSATASLELPSTRAQGLVVRLDAVAAAAATGDAAAVARAVAELDRVRSQTIDVIRSDLSVVAAAVARLPVTEIAEAVAAAHGTITATRDGVLDTLGAWRAQVARLRAVVEAAEGEQIAAMLRAFVDAVEAFLRARIVAGIDAQVDRAVEWVRTTFAQLPVRALRAEVSAAIAGAANAVRDADLDAPVRAVRGVVADVAEALTGADLAGQVRGALEDVLDALDAAVSGVVAALEAVATAVGEIQGQAEAVLLPAADVVRAFGVAIEEVRVSVEALDVQAAARQVIDRVRQIRTAVEGVVANVPLPEALRPVVEGIVEQLEALDLDSVRLEDVPVLAPILDAAKGFDVGGDLSATMDEGLTAVRAAIEAIVPTSLVESIDREVREALDVIADFDPSTLLSGVSELVDSAADAVEGVDLTAAVAPARVPFESLLGVWDRARPSTLLEPAARVFDDALAGIELPGTEQLATGFATTLDATGNAIGASLVTPLTRLAPEGTTVPAPAAAPGAGPGGSGGLGAPGGSGAPASPGAPGAPAPHVDVTGGVAGGIDAGDVRPGDAVRLLGFLPAKLREALAAVDTAVLADVLGALDRTTAALARDLRTAATAVARAEDALDTSFSAMFAPLGQAQARAQLAVHARFGAGGTSLDLAATSRVLAGCGRASMRLAVEGTSIDVRGRIRGAAARQATVSAELLAIADALDRCALAGLVGDADALLAALDPEPLAAEVDELARAVVRKAPEMLGGVATEIAAALTRFRAVLGELNPGAQAAKFEAVVAVLKEEVDLMNPRRLGMELDEVHATVRGVIEAYDPAVLAADIEALLTTAASELRALDPAVLLGDLSPFDDLVAAAEAANPATALADLSAQMTGLVDAFAGIDLDGILSGIAELPQQVVDAFVEVLQGIRVEITALLEALRYATGSASVSVSAEVRT